MGTEEPSEHSAYEKGQRRARRRKALGNFAVYGVIALAGGLLIFGGGDDGGGDEVTGEETAKVNATAGQLVANARPNQPSWEPHKGPVPILMYQDFGDPGPDDAYPDVFVSRDEFRAQLKWLSDNGYEAVTLARVQDAWYDDGTLPAKPIVLSFDDGYISHFEFVFPLLLQLGWPGVLYLRTEDSGLYSEHVKPMLRAGWELGSHTSTRPDLTTLNRRALREEVAGSRAALREKYGVAIANFAYPRGEYDARVIRAAETAGYESAATTEFGLADPDEPFSLSRIRVNRGDGAAGLQEALLAAGR